MTGGKHFTPEEARVLRDIILHRRDVRGNRFVHRNWKCCDGTGAWSWRKSYGKYDILGD